jgi:hypothetical protein
MHSFYRSSIFLGIRLLVDLRSGGGCSFSVSGTIVGISTGPFWISLLLEFSCGGDFHTSWAGGVVEGCMWSCGGLNS